MLSVIIPTRNRSALLQSALESMQSQTLPADHFEILVIDNGSTDNTKYIVSLFQQRFGNIRYFFDSTPGLHVGRHLGMKNARAEILVYADDDVIAFPTWLEGIIESFQDEKVALVGGKNLPKFETTPPDGILRMWEKDKNGNRMLTYLSILDFGNEKKVISPHYVFGCNFSIRKSILLEAGGFHPDSMPRGMIMYRGDGETHISRFILEKGYKAIYNPRASVYHVISKNRMTKEYLFQRCYDQGISDSYNIIRSNSYSKLIMRWLKYYIKISLMQADEFTKAHFLGFRYHQNLCKKNRHLLEWIERKNYINN